MKLKDSFVTVDDDKEAITVSTDTSLFSGLIRSNETAALILKCLEKETDIEAICSAIMKEYDADKDVVRKDVEKIVAQLRDIGAIDG